MNPPIDFHLPDVRDRARAAFLGLAVGDALGATVEFMKPGEIQAQFGVHREMVGGGWLHLRPGCVTDDTQMSLCIARALDAEGAFTLPAIATRFAAWMRSSPPDIGATCRRGIRSFLVDGTLEVPPREGDAGNGAAMRMVPVALFTLADGPLLERYAVSQAHLTHNHRLSDASCVLLGKLLHMACLGLSMSRMRRVVDEVVASEPRLGFEPYRGLSSGYVAETMQTVLHHFFTTRGFEECLVGVVNRGDDADTTGAIAGALAGAYYGPGEIPSRWLRRLDGAVREEIDRLVERLVDLSPLVNGSPPHFTRREP